MLQSWNLRQLRETSIDAITRISIILVTLQNTTTQRHNDASMISNDALADHKQEFNGL